LSILSGIYIDGFNLYYGALKGTSNRWLDLQKYFTQIRSDEEIDKIWYFTAKVNGKSKEKQEAYLNAISTCPLVKIVEGIFKHKKQKCKVYDCNHLPDRKLFSVPEEKQTDVNIALQIVRDAYEKKYANIILVSGDSDLTPALALVKEISPKTKITVYIPDSSGKRTYNTGEVRKIADHVKRLPPNNLSKAQFPIEIRDVQGNLISEKPSSW
jgi:6-hydroxy-3-succinoylpyridine 3-monooxygenase